MTRVPTRINMTMPGRTDSIYIAKSLETVLMPAFGLQGLVFGMVDVTSLNAAETIAASGNLLMKSDSHRGSGLEGLSTIAAADPILKPEKGSDRLKVGKKLRRLIRKPSAGGPQSESPHQADQGRPSSVPSPVDQATPVTKDSMAGMAKSAAGMSQITAPISSGSSISTRAAGVPASSAIAGGVTASPSSSMGAADLEFGIISSGGGRSTQNLMRQLPGLQQLLTAQPGSPPPIRLRRPRPRWDHRRLDCRRLRRIGRRTMS